METLKSLLAEHPEWGDLPIVVYTPDGRYDWLGGAAGVYTDDTPTNDEDLDKDVSKVSEWTKVLVFSAN